MLRLKERKKGVHPKIIEWLARFFKKVSNRVYLVP